MLQIVTVAVTYTPGGCRARAGDVFNGRIAFTSVRDGGDFDNAFHHNKNIRPG